MCVAVWCFAQEKKYFVHYMEVCKCIVIIGETNAAKALQWLLVMWRKMLLAAGSLWVFESLSHDNMEFSFSTTLQSLWKDSCLSRPLDWALPILSPQSPTFAVFLVFQATTQHHCHSVYCFWHCTSGAHRRCRFIVIWHHVYFQITTLLGVVRWVDSFLAGWWRFSSRWDLPPWLQRFRWNKNTEISENGTCTRRCVYPSSKQTLDFSMLG